MKLLEAAKCSEGKNVVNQATGKSFRVVEGCMKTSDKITLGDYDDDTWEVEAPPKRSDAKALALLIANSKLGELTAVGFVNEHQTVNGTIAGVCIEHDGWQYDVQITPTRRVR